jgi:hypothetical protein
VFEENPGTGKDSRRRGLELKTKVPVCFPANRQRQQALIQEVF